MNCITDFLPDDSSEHNADGENMDEIVFGIQPAPETLTPSELDAAIYGTPEYWQQMSSASIEAHTETLERVKVLEAENARLRDVMIEALAFARTGLIPMEFEPYVVDGETRRLHWNEHMRIQIAKLIDAALK